MRLGAVHLPGPELSQSPPRDCTGKPQRGFPVSRGDNDPISARFPAAWRAHCQGPNFHKARPATAQANCKGDSLFRVGITTLSLRASPQPSAVHCQGPSFHKARPATTQVNRQKDSPVSRGDNDPISARFPATWRRILPGHKFSQSPPRDHTGKPPKGFPCFAWG